MSSQLCRFLQAASAAAAEFSVDSSQEIPLLDLSSCLEPSGLQMPNEVEHGNVEYKLQLIRSSNDDLRFQQLVTQMKWRLEEGMGEACYILGLSDRGQLIGLPPSDLNRSIRTLTLMANQLGCYVEQRLRVKVNPITRFEWLKEKRRREERCWMISNGLINELNDSPSVSNPAADHLKNTSSVIPEHLKIDPPDDILSINEDLYVVECWIRANSSAAAPMQPSSVFSTFSSTTNGSSSPSSDALKLKNKEEPGMMPGSSVSPGVAGNSREVQSSGKPLGVREFRIMFLGASMTGKSTLMAALAHQELDNGRGRARIHLLKHTHELRTGRSSSIVHWSCSEADIRRFWRIQEEVIDNQPSGSNMVDNSRSSKSDDDSVTARWMLFDTCGHPKYQNTTLHALSGYNPSIVCLVVDGWSNTGSLDSLMTKELVGWVMLLGLPFVVVVTKIDLIHQNSRNSPSRDDQQPTEHRLEKTMEWLLKLLGPARAENREPVIVQSLNDVRNAADTVAKAAIARREKKPAKIGQGTKGVIPIFLLSSVTGECVPLLVEFMRCFRQNTDVIEKPLIDTAVIPNGSQDLGDIEFLVEDVYSVPEVGIVVGGRLLAGSLNPSMMRGNSTQGLYIGPFPLSQLPNAANNSDDSTDDNSIIFQNVDGFGNTTESGAGFLKVTVTSMHRQRRPVANLYSGESGALAIQFLCCSRTNGGSQSFSPDRNLSGESMSGVGSSHWESTRLRKGMVIVSGNRVRCCSPVKDQTSQGRNSGLQFVENPGTGAACWEFEAEMLCLYIPSNQVITYFAQAPSQRPPNTNRIEDQSKHSQNAHIAAVAPRRKRRNSSYSRNAAYQRSPLLSPSNNSTTATPFPSLKLTSNAKSSESHSGLHVDEQNNTNQIEGRIFCDMIQQFCTIVSILPLTTTGATSDRLQPGQSARIKFRFTRSPEYLKSGQQIMFREKVPSDDYQSSSAVSSSGSSSGGTSRRSKTGVLKMFGRVL